VPWAPEPPPRSGGFTFNDFITFRYLITPTLITIVYIIGAVLITLAALAAMVRGGAGGLLVGLLVLVFGNLYWRVILEFVMVLFRMNDSLRSIDRRGKGM
jgi:Na+(H+)/acetate symporter ActP